jgi:protein TonB
MREALPYLLSSLVHAALVGGMAVWTWPQEDLEVALAAGDPLQLTFYSPSMPATLPEKPVQIPLDSTPSQQPVDLDAQPLDMKRSPLESDSAERQSSQFEDSLPAEEHVAQRRETETPPQRETQTNAPRVPRHTPQRRLSVATSVAIPFQPPRNLGVSVDRLPSKLPTNPTPVWPRSAWLLGIEGRVVLRVLVKANGAVGLATVETSSGRDDVDESALAAVRQWRFAPAQRSGAPVDHEVLVPIRFSLRRG